MRLSYKYHLCAMAERTAAFFALLAVPRQRRTAGKLISTL
jgi:hypothetical protein